jgi:hypothetical protein
MTVSTLKHTTVTVPLNRNRTYTRHALIWMACEKAGIEERDLRADEVLEYGARTARIVLWTDAR